MIELTPTNLTLQDISSDLVVPASYTNNSGAAKLVVLRIMMSDLAGGGDYLLGVRHNDGAGDFEAARTTVSVGPGTTTLSTQTRPIAVNDGETLTPTVLGLVEDTAVAINIAPYDVSSVDVGSLLGDALAVTSLKAILTGSGAPITLAGTDQPGLVVSTSNEGAPAVLLQATGPTGTALLLSDSGIGIGGNLENIVAGLWSGLTADFITPGSVGKLITDNLDTQVSAVGGLTVDQESKVDAIQAKTDTISPDGISITLGSNVAADGVTLTIIQGEAKLASLSNALSIDITDARLTSAITSDGTVPVLRIAGAGAKVSLNGTVASFDDGTKTATCEWDLTAAQTAALPAGIGNKWELDWRLADSDTDVITSVIDAPCIVKRQIA